MAQVASFQNKLASYSYKWMNDQVYSVPGQTEGKRKAFFEWKSVNLSYVMNYVGLMLTIIKVFIILFLVRIGNILAIFKINQ